MGFLQLTHNSASLHFGQVVAAIYHHSQGSTPDDFQQHCYRELSRIVALGEGYWLVQSHDGSQNGKALQTALRHFSAPFDPRDDCGQDFDEAWLLSETLEPLSEQACGLRHAYGCRLSLPQSGVSHSFILTPETLDRPFSDKDIERLTLLLPHVVEAFRLNVLSRFKRGWESRHDSRAVCTSDGFVLESEGGFSRLLEREFPGWEGKRLPFSLADAAGFYLLGRVMFRIDKTLDIYHLQAVYLAPGFDGLTSKEKEVCFYLRQALANQGIADAMQISRKTVENHLANIYDKLGQISRADLFRLLQ
ncbi:helix-turn-helix transcriptional regulator [Thiomicrorhabdus sp.]|uniref:helix-turn-helix transcriptional regulator n=1 Tax=Thiomicrorhabdus sp. TaxID=2039724 RepID=UPI0029C772EA|nr:helix-turn-helix transcriptional regulator [Thiomicrorhabdus sp.]